MASSDAAAAPVVLVTGAAGFIGGYVVEEFVSEGWHVAALTHRRQSARLDELAAAGKVSVASGDAADPDLARSAILPLLRGRVLDAIVHCAGRASDVGRWAAFRRANLDSVRHMAALAGRMSHCRLVFVSTTDVYGLRDFSGEVEDELPLLNNTGNPYPEFKIQAEEYIRRTLPPERWSIIRPAAVWGVGDRTLTPRIVGFLRSSPWIVHFGRWRGRNRWPLAHVRNVAAAAWAAAVLPEAGGRAYNVLDDEHTSADEFYRLLAGIYLPGRKLASITVPVWVAWPWAAAVTGLSGALGLPRPLADPSLYALRTVSSNLDFCNRRLHELLAAAGRSLLTREEGLRELEAELAAKGPPAPRAEPGQAPQEPGCPLRSPGRLTGDGCHRSGSP